MKKVLLLVLAIALALPLVSCKKKETLGDKVDATVSSAGEAAEDAQKEAKKILE